MTPNNKIMVELSRSEVLKIQALLEYEMNEIKGNMDAHETNPDFDEDDKWEMEHEIADVNRILNKFNF